MTRTALPVLFLLTAAASAAVGQGVRPVPPGKTPPKTAPGDVPGYKKLPIEGFNVYVSRDVAAADVSGFERKPLDVLERELKMVAKAVNKKQLDFLRTLPVWVEWDEKVPLPNGREGFATAVYYGGHQSSLLAEGKNSPRFRAVTVLSLSRLTAAHQPNQEFNGCVLLHEFAHAVHDQAVTREQVAGIGAAFKQAMERKLYDKAQYVSTNESEFFAELTCAYFDRLGYFPRTRDELKKHDPASFKVLDGIWAAPKGDPAAVKATGLSDTGAAKYDLKITTADLTFGDLVAGPPLPAADAAGRVVVLVYWSQRDVTVLGKAAQIAQELGGFGAKVAVAAAAEGLDPARVKAEMDRRGVTLTAVDKAYVTDRARNQMSTQLAPHALVFDADGKCVFRGSGYDALPHARAAVARKLVADLATDAPPKALAKATDALANGEPFLDAVALLAPHLASKDADTAAAAKALHAALLAPAVDALGEAQKLRKTDPLTAFLAAEKLAAGYKGTPPGTKAGELATELRSDKAVAAELRARKLFEDVAKCEKTLDGQPGSFDPTAAQFRFANADTLKQLKTAVEKLRKQYPTAKVTAEADRIAATYGVR